LLEPKLNIHIHAFEQLLRVIAKYNIEKIKKSIKIHD